MGLTLALTPLPAGADDIGVTGEAIAIRGVWSAGVPACVSCHGPGGRGIGAFPALAGRREADLLAQLKAWKSGTRTSDPLGLMRAVAGRLDDRQIAAVAAYFAGQPGGAPKSSGAGAPASGTTARAPATPGDDLAAVIARGEAIFRDPSAYAGAYVGNSLTCQNCHLDAGRLVNSAPMGLAYVRYPMFRAKEHRVLTYAERLQGCFRYSMNGRPPPLGGDVLVALESYSFALARGVPVGATMPGSGYPKLPAAAKGFDIERGGAVFAAKCTLCHGADGAGQRAEGRTVFPALWGRDSYNWGAGMTRIQNAAGFIKANMPLALGGTLTDQEAWDVAAYIDGMERPQDPRFTGDVTETRRKYHDTPMSLYGQMVRGAVLGANATPSGPREVR